MELSKAFPVSILLLASPTTAAPAAVIEAVYVLIAPTVILAVALTTLPIPSAADFAPLAIPSKILLRFLERSLSISLLLAFCAASS